MEGDDYDEEVSTGSKDATAAQNWKRERPQVGVSAFATSGLQPPSIRGRARALDAAAEAPDGRKQTILYSCKRTR